MSSDDVFVHLLVYECQECGRPVPCAILSDQANPEDVDSQTVTFRCSCKSRSEVLGLNAKRHLVVDWQSSVYAG